MIIDVLFSSLEIRERTRALARELVRSHKYLGPDVTFLVVMNGAFRFAADLLSYLPDDWNPTVDFVTMANYKGTAGGTPIFLLHPHHPILDKHVVVLEDIVDRGDTMNVLGSYLREEHAASVSLITLLRREKSPKQLEGFDNISYGFQISSDAFVVGYGLDYSGRFRTYNFINHLHSNVDTLY